MIIIDLDMPEMDGWAFRGEQRRAPRLAAIPAIVLSATANFQAQVEELEAREGLPKPATSKPPSPRSGSSSQVSPATS